MNNDHITADYMIRSSRCKAMGENSRRHLYKTQQQLKQEWVRQQAKNNERNREKEESSTRTIEYKREEGGKRQQVLSEVNQKDGEWTIEGGKLTRNQELYS